MANLLRSDEMGGHTSLDDMNNQSVIGVLQNQIESLLYKFVYMIMLSGKTIP